jgi:hypothetical protein
MFRRFPVAPFLLLLAGCAPKPDRAPALGEAYIGPASLQIRSELVARAPVAATVTHGERVEVIGRRRTMYRIRTRNDAEGWIDGRQLLNTSDMTALAALREKAKTLSSLGKATVFDVLNVHTIPNRYSPSFFQIKPNEKVDVVGYVRAPRVAYEANLGIRFAASRAKKRRTPPRPEILEDLPAPKPPPLPADWLELSGNPHLRASAPVPSADPNPMDDWALVRAADGRAGWVLARILWMALPEEVAQYAERARIISYFALNAPLRPGQTPAWFWTTRSSAAAPGVDFDGARVFVYNARRNRYETAWFEKRLRGFFPVWAGKPGPIGLAPFRFCVEEGGQLVTREYAFQGERPRLTARKPAGKPVPLYTPGPRFNDPGGDSEEPESPQGLWNRFTAWISSFRSSR